MHFWECDNPRNGDRSEDVYYLQDGDPQGIVTVPGLVIVPEIFET